MDSVGQSILYERAKTACCMAHTDMRPPHAKLPPKSVLSIPTALGCEIFHSRGLVDAAQHAFGHR